MEASEMTPSLVPKQPPAISHKYEEENDYGIVTFITYRFPSINLILGVVGVKWRRCIQEEEL